MKLSCLCFFVLLVSSRIAFALPDVPRKYSSEIITRDTKGHRVSIEIDISGAKFLFLEVDDGGNGSGYDWADWIEPRLIGSDKPPLELSKLEWRKVDGKALVGTNQAGGPLRVDGKPVTFGIGTHAKSVIVYDLPGGYTTFRAQGGLDNGGTDQPGSHSSVVFRAYTKEFDNLDNMAAGFRVDIIYDADLSKVGSWVALGVDGKGRLITSDRQGAMYRIVVPPLDSSEQAKVSRLPVNVGGANGILEAFGSLYVVAKGYKNLKGKSGLYRLTDTSGDDHYDKVEFLIPLTVGGDHHAHAVLLHPDGKRLVILNGNMTDVPGEIATRNIRNQAEDHLLPRGTYYGHNTGRKAPGGYILICNPDGAERRIHCAGFRNPYDFAFHRSGELFVFDADMEYDIGGPWYRPTRVNHAVSGAEFGWRWGAGKWPAYYPDSNGSVVDIGRGSPTGVVFGYGAKFPAKYQEALFIADWTYGRMFAVHLTPEGATYRGKAELFVQGRGMPISDVVIRPQDGAMYYVTGGRRQKTHLYRVTYAGDESTIPVRPKKPSKKEADLRIMRRSLEAFHGREDVAALTTAWPKLSHPDRSIRFAARTAIEHQPVATWASKVFVEQNSIALIESAVAMARSGGKEYAAPLLKRLEALRFSELALEHQLDLLRAYGLVFIRMAPPDESTARHLVATLSPMFPSGTRSLDRELCQMLLYLDAPGATAKSVKQLLAADTQAEEMFYAYHLRTIRGGWALSDRVAYFGWMNSAESRKEDYVGGGHFGNFLKLVRSDATKSLDAEQREALSEVLARKTPPPLRPAFESKFVREWKQSDLESGLSDVEVGRSFIRGKKINEAICAQCHLFKGKGGALGPDLTSVGSKMNYKALLTEIFEPSRVISDQHASSILVLKNGTILEGREVGGDDNTISIAVDPKNPEKVKEVRRRDIASKSVSKTSMMPTDLLNVLEREEILDLLMYLSSGGQAGHTAFDQ